jgi:lactoylglutathione lyase
MQERDGLLELVYVKGCKDPIPRSFGHIGISVPDIKAAEERFKAHNVEIYKPTGESDKRGMCIDEKDWDKGPDLTEGFRRVFTNMMMIRDPDGYFIEVVPYGAG